MCACSYDDGASTVFSYQLPALPTCLAYCSNGNAPPPPKPPPLPPTLPGGQLAEDHVASIDVVVAGDVADYPPNSPALIAVRQNVASVFNVDPSRVTIEVIGSSVTLRISITSPSFADANQIGESLRLVFNNPTEAARVFDSSTGAPALISANTEVDRTTTPRYVWNYPLSPPSTPPPLSPPPPITTPLLPPPAPPVEEPANVGLITSLILGGIVIFLILAIVGNCVARATVDTSVAPDTTAPRAMQRAASTRDLSQGAPPVRMPSISDTQYEYEKPRRHPGLERLERATTRPLHTQHLYADHQNAVLSRQELGRYLRGDWRESYQSMRSG